MSQKKVDRYKEQKANRQQIMKKEKRMRRLEVFGLTAVLVALVAWFSVAVVHQARSNNTEPVQATEIATADLESYLGELSSAVNGDAEDVEESSDAEEADEASDAEADEASDTEAAETSEAE